MDITHENMSPGCRHPGIVNRGDNKKHNDNMRLRFVPALFHVASSCNYLQHVCCNFNELK